MKIVKLSDRLTINLEKFNMVDTQLEILYLDRIGCQLSKDELKKLNIELNSDEEKRIRQLKNVNYSLKAILTLNGEEVIEQIKKIVERIERFIDE